MLELRIKEKERIGKLFKYYRKKNKVQWKDVTNICSGTTYSKIEKGMISRNDTIYDELFTLYKIDYQIKSNFDEWLNNYLNRMKNILEYYKEEQFDSLIEELEKELGTYKHGIIYEQYYQVITYILNFYKYSKYMTLEEIEDCFNLFEYFNFEEIIMIYLLEVMFISNNNSINSQQIFDDLLPLLEQYQSEPIIKYVNAFCYKVQARFESSLELFKELFDYNINKDNVYRATKALMGKYIIYSNIDYKKAEETVEKLIQLKEQNKLYKSLIPNINFNIGMYYYLNNNYKKAFHLFMENVNEYKRNREWFYICSICTQLEIPIPDEFNDYNVQENEDPMIMEYFYMKFNKYSKRKLVDYITKIILPQCLIHESYRQPYWAVFEEELLVFSKQDKRFVDTLLEFLDLEKKTCKKC